MAANTVERKRYNKIENVIQYISKEFVSLDDAQVKKVMPLLNYVIDNIFIAKMKEDPLFKSLYTTVLYGGSFYDKLKVGHPDEFDIDLVFVLPKLVDAKLEISNQPGFVNVKMPGWELFKKSSDYEKNKKLEDFKDKNNYLLTHEILRWIESIGTQVLNKYPKNGKVAQVPYNNKTIGITLKKSGPALTALITYENINLDVDLVASFKFTHDKWPASPFKALPNECQHKKEFLIVPKEPKNVDVNTKGRFWRLSFQEQEKVILSGNNRAKPVLRLMKKLRDTQNHSKISSYFLKTVFLWEIENRKSDHSFWDSPLSFIFMHMLTTYRDCLQKKEINYFWNKKYNLLKYIDAIVIENFTNYLSRVIKDIDNHVDTDPYVVGKYLSTPEEHQKLKKNVRV